MPIDPAPLTLAAPDELKVLQLDVFPVIDDFSVTVADDEDRIVEFRSAAHGRLAGFPAWENADRDLRHFTPPDVPLGTIDEPFEDRDEEWRMLLFEHGGFIHVLEGESPRATEFPRWFRVPTAHYLRAWAALIDFYNPPEPFNPAADA